MNITIKRPFLDQLKDKGFKEIDTFLRYNDWNKSAAMKIDVGEIVEAQLAEILKVIKKDPVVNKNSLSTIELWKKARENPKDQVPRTLEHFATILKEYIGTFDKYRFFEQSDNGDWMAYVAVGTGYRPPKRHRDGVTPAATWLKGAYYQRGEIRTRTWYFSALETKGRRCSEIIDNSKLISATKVLEEQYEKELVIYKTLRGAVGKQMWGKGYAEAAGSKDSWRSDNGFSLDIDGRKAKLVIDSHIEGKDKSSNESTEGVAPTLDGSFWVTKASQTSGDDDAIEAHDNSTLTLDVPLYPEILVFNLEKHEQAWAHVNRLEEYVYDKTLGEKLVLPEYQKELIEILVQRDRAEMVDIISGKAGGSVVLCSGVPGTGKTLTAEVFAETIERPLYVVASSQLGVEPAELESELKTVLDRASRLGAIMLIDEADVYIHSRGESMVQNAVVGIFLRILEYFQGILFLTTNRETTVDDAIVSRCTAQVKYDIPTPEGQKRIWKILSKLSNLKITDAELDKFIKKHPKLSGRDVKGLLKLANMIAVKRGEHIDSKLLEYVLAFKPTYENMENK